MFVRLLTGFLALFERYTTPAAPFRITDAELRERHAAAELATVTYGPSHPKHPKYAERVSNA